MQKRRYKVALVGFDELPTGAARARRAGGRLVGLSWQLLAAGSFFAIACILLVEKFIF